MGDRQSFSLKEEARHTSRRSRSHWTPESRLRKNPVAFTSSGARDPFQDGEQAVKTDHTTETRMVERNPPQSPPNARQSASASQSLVATTPEVPYPQPPGIIPSKIQETLCEAGRQETLPLPHGYPEKERPPSPTPSCRSDEEVILFTGRNKGQERSGPTRLPPSESTQELKGQAEVTASVRISPLPEDNPQSSTEDANNDSDEGDGTTSDYLANLLASGEQITTERFHFRELGASDDEICFSQSDAISASISLDSDMDIGHAVSWSTRRKKKRVGKYARKGLQSRKKALKEPKPHDLFSLYPTGMTMDQVIEELQWFLLSSEEQLSFPPLSKSFRKMLHEMAGRLHLKSKSIGKGDTRRPVLYRTKATPLFDTGSFEAVTSKITRRFWGSRSKPGTKRPRAGGAGFTGYRDGEVVGSGMPELGSENRGRAMLEKMGWSTGMSLGSADNEGILQPVSQVMKRTKAGLGQE